MLDKAKAYPLLAEQYPEMVSQIDKAEPFTRTLYRGYSVILTKVFRFDAEDALIFQVEFVNETDQSIYYVPQSLAVRVGPGVYWSSLDGAELPLHGMALDMERNETTGTWQLTDGSAGLKGDILKTDNWAEIKLFAATFLSAATKKHREATR